MAVTGILIDTNAYSAFKTGEAETIELFQHAPLLAINTVVVGELLGGFVLGKYEKKNRKELEIFLSLPKVVLCEFTLDVSEQYSQVYKQLRRAGTPIPTNDMWIAATALHYNLAVCTYDGHFKKVQGLEIVQNMKELKLLL